MIIRFIKLITILQLFTIPIVSSLLLAPKNKKLSEIFRNKAMIFITASTLSFIPIYPIQADNNLIVTKTDIVAEEMMVS